VNRGAIDAELGNERGGQGTGGADDAVLGGPARAHRVAAPQERAEPCELVRGFGLEAAAAGAPEQREEKGLLAAILGGRGLVEREPVRRGDRRDDGDLLLRAVEEKPVFVEDGGPIPASRAVELHDEALTGVGPEAVHAVHVARIRLHGAVQREPMGLLDRAQGGLGGEKIE
jgi:hypothetical protein